MNFIEFLEGLMSWNANLKDFGMNMFSILASTYISNKLSL